MKDITYKCIYNTYIMIDKFIKENIPSTFKESILHRNICGRLLFINKNKNNFPNLLFYGNQGKKILINLLIINLFEKIYLKSITEYNISYNFSNYHIEINVKENIKTVDKNISEFLNFYKSNKSIINQQFKLVVIYYFDLLDIKTQQELRRIFEAPNLRIIIHCSKFNKIISPIRSRFLSIRVPSIGNDEATLFFKYLSKKYNYRLPKINNLIELATFKSVISIKKIKFIFYMKLLSKENKVKYNIEFENEIILKHFINELSQIGKIEPFIIMNNCIEILLLYQKKNYDINDLFYCILTYICSLSIPDQSKLNIINIVSYMESQKHSREIIFLESTISQIIDILNM